MELKDMILSTLAELEERPLSVETKVVVQETVEEKPVLQSGILKAPNTLQETPKEEISEEEGSSKLSDERIFCEHLRERVLVLFEGFQSPNNKNIEAKIDLTLNFLEYLLATIDERLENLDSK